MPDYIDHATETQEQMLENNITAIINRRVGRSLPECLECGQPIPAERRLKARAVSVVLTARQLMS